MNIDRPLPPARPLQQIVTPNSASETAPKTPLLLPAAAISARALVGAALIPQAILLVLNLQTWHLISGEVTDSQRTTAFAFFAAELVLLIAAAVYTLHLATGRHHVPRLAGLALMFLPAGYLAAAMCSGQSFIPASVATWIVPPGQWLFKQFVFVAPLVLYGALRFACPTSEEECRSRLVGLRGVILVTGGAVGLALFGNVLASILSPVFGLIFDSAATFVIAPIALAGALCFGMLIVALILRVGLSLYVGTRRRCPAGLAALTAIVAIGGPLAGLALNSQVAFPTDLQSPIIYALAILNGIVLTLPNFAHPLLHRAVWLAQCALFPFTIYFFILFLPWLPLTPLAVCFFGFGLLMVVPALLFLLHGHRLIDGFRAELRDGHWLVPAAIGLAAILAWPFGITVSARADRAALHQALDYVAYPDYARATPFPGDRASLGRSLRHLREFKDGFYLPFLSEYRNWLTFDNLVLPDSQLDALETTFFGAISPNSEPAGFGFDFAARNRRRTATAINPPTGERPTTDAITQSVVITRSGSTRLATLTIHNPTAETTEYQTSIALPPGVDSAPPRPDSNYRPSSASPSPTTKSMISATVNPSILTPSRRPNSPPHSRPLAAASLRPAR